MQKQKNKVPEQVKETGLEDLAVAYKANKEKVVTKIITLYYQSCCGCGCNDVALKREVPMDSKLKDGSRISYDEILDTDEILD